MKKAFETNSKTSGKKIDKKVVGTTIFFSVLLLAVLIFYPLIAYKNHLGILDSISFVVMPSLMLAQTYLLCRCIISSINKDNANKKKSDFLEETTRQKDEK